MIRNPFKELDAKNRKMSSDVIRKSLDPNKVVNQRVKIFITSIGIVFLVIALQLVRIQYVKNEEYTDKLLAFTKKNQVIAPPRGEITDRNGKVLVTNKEILNITYYPPKDVSNYEESKWRLAYDFAQQFNIKSDQANFREWQDFYLVVDEFEGKNLLSQQEYDQVKEDNAKYYAARIEKVTQEKIDELRQLPQSKEDKERGRLSNEQKYIAWPVMMRMEQATSFSPSIVVENASSKHVAYLVEHKEDFAGFDVQADWERSYPYQSVLRDVLGKVSTQGLENESKDYYLAQGYALNSRFGSSGLEQQYEKYLSGTRTVKEISYDEESGVPVFTTIKEGKKGYNMRLTIDVDLQQKVDQIIRNSLTKNKNAPGRKYYKSAFVVLMDPNTGEILASSGQQMQEDGSFIPYASGTYLENHMPGSVVKLATLYMGLNEGVVSPGEIILDAPMTFAGGLTKASFNNYGPLSDVQAIAKSSNVYMFHIAIRMAGGHYVPNGPLYLPHLEQTYETYRRYFAMFGLGVKTGVDVPYEESGVGGIDDQAGLLLDYSIGQYETYTTLQLAQYAATVGTGKRVTPHFMKEIYEVNSKDSSIYQYNTHVLDTIDGNTKYIERIKQGMRDCVTTAFCGVKSRNLDRDIAGKTGTAEVELVEGKTNSAYIGFAPSEKPTIAFACEAPTASSGHSWVENPCTDIMGDVLAEYYKTYN